MIYLPPKNKRCQSLLTPWYRCIKEGTHWWISPGCGCEEQDSDVCVEEGELSWWVCDGPHVYEELIVGEPTTWHQ